MKKKPPINDQLARQLGQKRLKPKATQGNGYVWAGANKPRDVGPASAYAGESKRLYRSR